MEVDCRPRQMGPNGPEPFPFPILEIPLGSFYWTIPPIEVRVNPIWESQWVWQDLVNCVCRRLIPNPFTAEFCT